MAYFLYVLTFANGKLYVGITSNPERRLAEHKYNSQKGGKTALYAAIRKYGLNSFSMNVLVCGNKHYIGNLEILAIATWKTRYPNGYNISFGGDLSPALVPEVRAKIGEAAVKKWKDPAYREKISSAARAWKHTDQQKARNAEAKRRHWNDPEYRAKTTAAHIGKKHSAETVAKRRVALAAAWAEGKGREARITAMRGRLWVNNGVEHRQLRAGEIAPHGWVSGMLPMREEVRSALRKRIWITDGQTSTIVFSEAEIPSGWAKGRTIPKRACA